MAAGVVSEGRKERIEEDPAMTVDHGTEKFHSSVVHVVVFGLGFAFKKAFYSPMLFSQ